MKVTTVDYTDTPRRVWGVFADGEPRGRVRLIEGAYVGFTNKREPGPAARVGSFDTLDEAALVVAEVKS